VWRNPLPQIVWWKNCKAKRSGVRASVNQRSLLEGEHSLLRPGGRQGGPVNKERGRSKHPVGGIRAWGDLLSR